MQHKTVPLAQLRVESPCDRDWDAMTGDERTRFCVACGKHVHDLTQLTTAEAEQLVATSDDHLCVRYAPTADGGVQVLDYAPPRRARFRTRVWLPVALLGSAAAAVLHAFMVPKTPPPFRGGMVMGDIAPSSQTCTALPIGKVAAPSRPTPEPDVSDERSIGGTLQPALPARL